MAPQFHIKVNLSGRLESLAGPRRNTGLWLRCKIWIHRLRCWKGCKWFRNRTWHEIPILIPFFSFCQFEAKWWLKLSKLHDPVKFLIGVFHILFDVNISRLPEKIQQSTFSFYSRNVIDQKMLRVTQLTTLCSVSRLKRSWSCEISHFDICKHKQKTLHSDRWVSQSFDTF